MRIVLEIDVAPEVLQAEFDGMVAEGTSLTFEQYLQGQPQSAADYAAGWWLDAKVRVVSCELSAENP